MKRVLIYQSIVFISIFLTLFLLVIIYQKPTILLTPHVKDEISNYEHSFVERGLNHKDSRLIKHEQIHIIFAGDLIFFGSTAKTIEKYGVDYPFVYVKDEIKAADHAVVNLESAVTNRTEEYEKKFNFKFPPHYLEGLVNAGFNMVSLANNHTMDYREEGLVDTMDNLRKYGIEYFGAGRNAEEAYSANVIELKGKKVAFLGFSHVLPYGTWYATDHKPGIASGYQLDRMLRIVKDEKEKNDYVLVYMHWGEEGNKTPEKYQVNYGRALIDAGVDAVIGAHPHVLQPIEVYNGKPIAYSLGNFLFPDYVSGPTAETGLLHLYLEEDKVWYEFSEYRIYKDQIHPR